MLWFIVASAVIVSLGRLFSPYADTLRPALEGLLSGMFGQPVRIERVEARWPRLSPQVELRGLRVGPEHSPLLNAEQAQLEFRLYNLVRPGRNSFELVVLGLELVLDQDETGQWSWRLDRGGTFAEGWEQVVSAGDVSLRDSSVRVSPHVLPELHWSVPEASLSRSGSTLGVRLQALPAVAAGETLEVRMQLEMPNSQLTSLRAYAVSPNFALTHLAMDSTAAAVDDLRAQMQAWFSWQPEPGARLHAKLDLHSLAEDGIAGRMSSRFEIDGYWRGGAFGIEFNAHEFGPRPSILIDRLAWQADGDRQALAADHVELDYLHALLAPWLDFYPQWPAELQGTAQDLDVAGVSSGALFRARGRIDSVHAQLPDFSVARLDLELGLSGDRLRLDVGGSPRLELPRLYSEAIEFRQIEGRFRVSPALLEIDGLILAHAELDARVDGDVAVADGHPVLDLVVDLPRLEPEKPAAWLPLTGIPENTLNWLQKALEQLVGLNAVTTLFGDASNWNEKIAEGALHSIANFRGLRLRYGDDWPVARQLEGRVEFSGQRMDAEVRRGEVDEVVLRAPRVRIQNTRDAEVEIELESVRADASKLAQLVGEMPLDGAGPALEVLDWYGPADASAEILLPVKHRDDWTLSGLIQLRDSHLTVVPHGVRLEGMRGEIPYSRHAIGPAEIDLVVDGARTSLELQGLLSPSFELDLRGDLPARSLIPNDWRVGLEQRIQGNSVFELAFEPRQESGRGQVLQIRSELRGVSLSFPEPLTKHADESWPLEIRVPLGDPQDPARFGLANRISGEILTAPDYWQIGLGLGGRHVDLPMSDNFIIAGEVETLELDRWLAMLTEVVGTGGDRNEMDADNLSGWLDVAIGDLRLGPTRLGPVALAMTREGQYWRLESDGERLQGSLRLPASGRVDRDVVADFARLHWPGVSPDHETEPAPPSRADPMQMPDFSIAIRDLRWGDLDLGEFRASAFRNDRGLEIERFTSRRVGFELSGSGFWTGDTRPPSSTMRVRLSTGDLGSALRAAGFEMALQRGNAMITFDGQWPGSPLDFSLQRADGTLELTVNEGSIPEASPGAGRLLGLVSLSSIPRRLRLDFSDVFGEGLSFDRIAGSFDLLDGVASTENLRIDSPAAEIRIRGRTDLRNRRYDQIVLVRPGVSSALPVIGLLAGGPVGAAAGAALQQIFSRPLRGISEIRYAVTGPLDAPEIRPVDVREE